MDKWARVFGEDRIIPRIYDKRELLNQTIVDDFLFTVGIESRRDFESSNDENKSLSHLGLEILRRINEQIPRHLPNGRPNTARKGLLEFVENHFGGGKYVMSQDLFSAYRASYSCGNEAVREKYFPERDVLFKKKKRALPTTVDIPEDDLQLILNFIVDIWKRDGK